MGVNAACASSEFYAMCGAIEGANPDAASDIANHLANGLVHDVETTNDPLLYPEFATDIDDMPFLIDAAKYAADAHRHSQTETPKRCIQVPKQLIVLEHLIAS